MKKIPSLFVSIILVINIALGSDANKTYKRLINKADRIYLNYGYADAIDTYLQALDHTQQKSYAMLMVANCYRLMNKPRQAASWYKLIELDTVMKDSDYFNYIDVLLQSNERERIESLLKRIENPELRSLERIAKLKNSQTLYRDSILYDISRVSWNSEFDEFAPVAYGQGVVFVSNRSSGKITMGKYSWDNTNFLDLYYMESGMESPVPLKGKINSAFHEGPLAFIKNDEVIFTRNNYHDGQISLSEEGTNKLSLYSASLKSGSKWKKVEKLPINNEEYSYGHPSITNSGDTLYFASDQPGSIGETDIFFSVRKNNNWSEPSPVGFNVNTIEKEMFPYISPDNVLYFASSGHQGLGGLDLYYVDLKAQEPTPVNMGYPVNSTRDDFGIFITDNGGYFTSNRTNNDDIYKMVRQKSTLTINLFDEVTEKPIKANVTVSKSTNQQVIEQKEHADQLEVILDDLEDITISIHRNGELIQQNTVALNTLQPGQLKKEISLSIRSKPDAEIIVLKNSFNKSIKVLKYVEGEKIETIEIEKEMDLAAWVSEENLASDNRTEIEPVYFDYDDYTIRKDAQEALLKLIAMLERQTALKLILTGHTDNRGKNKYNLLLSRKRVETVYNFLINAGIDESKLTIDYKGEDFQAIRCDNKVCSEQEHQFNRRVEINVGI